MKCPKCNYTSFDYNDACPKCGRDLIPSREQLGLLVSAPQAKGYLEALISGEGNEFIFEEAEMEQVDLGAYEEDGGEAAETEGDMAASDLEEVRLTPEAEEEALAAIPEIEAEGIDFSFEDEDIGLSLEDEEVESALPTEEGDMGLAVEVGDEGLEISMEEGPAEAPGFEEAGETLILESGEAPGLDLEDETVIIEPGAEAEIDFSVPEVETGEGEEALVVEDLEIPDLELEPEITLELETGDEGVLGIEETVILETDEMLGLEDIEPEVEVEADLGEETMIIEPEAVDVGALGVEETVILETDEMPSLEDIEPETGVEADLGEETMVLEPEADEDLDLTFEEELEGGVEGLDLEEMEPTEEVAEPGQDEETGLDPEATVIIEPGDIDVEEAGLPEAATAESELDDTVLDLSDLELDEDLELVDEEALPEVQGEAAPVVVEDMDLDLEDMDLAVDEDDLDLDLDDLDLEDEETTPPGRNK